MQSSPPTLLQRPELFDPPSDVLPKHMDNSSKVQEVAFTVQGTGIDGVDGDYHVCGEADGRPLYRKSCYTTQKCEHYGGRWYISCDFEGFFFSAAGTEDLPPAHGWQPKTGLVEHDCRPTVAYCLPVERLREAFEFRDEVGAQQRLEVVDGCLRWHERRGAEWQQRSEGVCRLHVGSRRLSCGEAVATLRPHDATGLLVTAGVPLWAVLPASI